MHHRVPFEHEGAIWNEFFYPIDRAYAKQPQQHLYRLHYTVYVLVFLNSVTFVTLSTIQTAIHES